MSADEGRVDAAIIGSGPAGAALAAAFAGQGFEVLLLERNQTGDPSAYGKVLRGEWIAPWGVEQLQMLGLYDALATKGQTITTHIRYEPPERGILDLAGLVPDVPGPLGIEYATLSATLLDQALCTGARLADGIRLTEVTAGARPMVHYVRNGQEHTVTARVIIGADGRASAVRKKLGIRLETAPLHHYVCGLLLADIYDWPADTELHVLADDTCFLVSGVGGGRFRTYLYVDPETFRALGPQRLPEVCRVALAKGGLPGIEAIAAGRPASAHLGMPNAATWTDMPYRDGAVLIGDSAGSDDPITGQGLSAAFQDVRKIADLLASERNWSRPGLFGGYAERKAERLRRQRFTSAAFAVRDAEFTDDAIERRRKIHGRLIDDPSRGLGLLSQYIGPDRLPRSAFSGEAWDRIFDGNPPPDFIYSPASQGHAEPLCV